MALFITIPVAAPRVCPQCGSSLNGCLVVDDRRSVCRSTTYPKAKMRIEITLKDSTVHKVDGTMETTLGWVVVTDAKGTKTYFPSETVQSVKTWE